MLYFSKGFPFASKLTRSKVYIFLSWQLYCKGDSEIQVYNLDTDEATSIHIPDDESSNYVVINAEESAIMPLLNNDQAFVIKKPKLSDLNDKNDGKARPYKCDICQLTQVQALPIIQALPRFT